MPSKTKFTQQRQLHLLRHHSSISSKENISPIDKLLPVDAVAHSSFTSNPHTPRSALALKRQNISLSPSPIFTKISPIDSSSSMFPFPNCDDYFHTLSISVKLSRTNDSSTSTSFSTPSLSSNQTPSFSRFAGDSRSGTSLEKLCSVSASVEEETPLDFYQMIHIQALLDVIKQMVCSSCHQIWDGSISIKKREGKKSPFFFE
jgi:hypothetical protein